MAEAFILVNTETDGENEVLRSLMSVEGVEEAYVVYGVYDIVVRIKAPNVEALKRIVTTNIRKIPKVKSTLTMMVVEGRRVKATEPKH